MNHYKSDLVKIKAFIFDVDGVLGSDRVVLSPDGELLRTMNIKDGYSMQYAVKKGYILGIITGGNNESIRTRFKNLGITDIYMKSRYKLDDYKDMISKHELKDEEVLYMGDDMPDFEVMQRVGIAACPYTACDEIKSISRYISDKAGGEGCVRDVIEQVLKVQKNWMEPSEAFSW